MSLLKPRLPAYDIGRWQAAPFPERARQVCQAWAEQGYGTPGAIYLLYAAKIAAWLGVWALACTLSPGRTLGNVATWWATPDAFARFVVWTSLFEGLGFGCGSGPLTGRYLPPLGGLLYFLRPGTTKLPLVPGLPLVGGYRRTWLDVGLYALAVGLMLRALLAPEVSPAHLLPVLVVVPLLGLVDKTLFLAFRSEHYLSSMLCLCCAALWPQAWIVGNKVVWVAIWWWAATSKLNRHFPAVMCVMTSNAPWTAWGPLRRWVYRDPPHDLRPSRFAGAMAHSGTLLEAAFPLVLLLSGDGPLTVPVLVVATIFHLFIMSNVPMGVPLEWNVVMIYGAWVLFGVHGDVGLAGLAAMPALAAWLFVWHVLVPLYGSQHPSRMSFLLSMRYYAGNWAFSVWLWRPEALQKLDRSVVKVAPLVEDQLKVLYDDDTVTALMSKVMAFRLMHLHGRALHPLLPIAAGSLAGLDDYVWLDGEIVAGLVLGWNFGEGHLHDQQLVDALQAQCGFGPGDVRVVMVESQPIFGGALSWRVVDAATGPVAAGETVVATLVDAHPWPQGSTRDPCASPTTD
ncbi:MAG: DUF3556 domain-containing protein [Myxococcota bacterium]